uniref:Piwi domain-containing protein n=1 Tax=Caenorhabditis tropicalis TaxID=1561998 RepID=A0A1I7U6W5_9PELO
MPERVVRLSMETALCCGEDRIKLSDQHTSITGGLNTLNRRLTLFLIYRNVLAKRSNIFGSDIHKYAYDCAKTIYAIEEAYKGDDEIKLTLEEKDFSAGEWKLICRTVRKPETRFEVVISANGFVYSQGPDPQELITLIEAVSSEDITMDLQYSYHMFSFGPWYGPEADKTAEIVEKLYKEIRLMENGKVAMLFDFKYIPFYDEMSVLKFLTLKYAKFKRISGIAPIQIPSNQGQWDLEQRGQRAQRGEQNPRNRSRSRSPLTPEEPAQEVTDYNLTEAIDVEAVFKDKRYPEFVKDIEESMKGIIAKPTHLTGEYNHNIVITGFSKENAIGQKVFMKKSTNEQEEVTVFEYFEIKHNHTIIFPYLPLIVTGKGERKAYFPMELLQIVPAQRIKAQKQSAALKSLITEKNTVLPREYMAEIKMLWEERWKNNRFLAAFGIKVGKKVVSPYAKMLHPPAVLFKNDMVCSMKEGTVQFAPLEGTHFWKPATVGTVAVINFDGAIEDETKLQTFCEKLYNMCLDNGMTMTTQPDTWTRLSLPSEEIGNLEETMSDLKKENVTIIIGITKEKKPTVHNVLKYFEATLGIPTLHIHIDTANHFINMIKGDETIQNVIRKLNPKCGGINFLVEPPESTLLRDTVHWIRESLLVSIKKEPTFVGCSYSLELATDLGGFNYLQEFNEYKLKNVEDKIEECLNHYNTAVGRFPKTVVVFRTGAGEDDFKRVQEEVVDMKKVLEDKNIKLVVLLVQKTSRIRIFPAGITGAQQNVKSGTVIDDTITSPGRNEFIMVSQTAKKGTARPIRYTEVVNEPEWTKDELYHLTYFLAFGHQVSYQPPAVPNVVYAAENLVKRGRNNFLLVYSNPYSSELGNLETTITDVLEEHEDPNDREFDEHILDEINYTLNGHALVRRNFWA